VDSDRGSSRADRWVLDGHDRPREAVRWPWNGEELLELEAGSQLFSQPRPRSGRSGSGVAPASLSENFGKEILGTSAGSNAGTGLYRWFCCQQVFVASKRHMPTVSPADLRPPVEGVAQESIHQESANTMPLSTEDVAAILRIVV